MERFRILLSHPKRTLAALGVVLAAVGIAIGSGAAFTAQTANPGNTFATGALSMSNSKDGAAILTATGLKPGDTTTGTVDIGNTGTVSGAFTLSRTALTNSDTTNPLANQLNLLVEDCGLASGATPATCEASDPDMYDGTLAAFTNTAALGNYAPGDQHRYRFTVTFAAGAGNEYQGDSATATFTWNATS